MMHCPYDSSMYFETPPKTTDKKHQGPSPVPAKSSNDDNQTPKYAAVSITTMIPPKRPFPRHIKSSTPPRHLLLAHTQIPPPPQSSPPPHFSSQTTTHKHYTASAAQPAPSSNTDSQPRRTRYSRDGVGQPRPSTPLLAPSQVRKHNSGKETYPPPLLRRPLLTPPPRRPPRQPVQPLVVAVDVADGVQHAPRQLHHGEHVDLLGEAAVGAGFGRGAGLVDGGELEEFLGGGVDLGRVVSLWFFGIGCGGGRG